MEAHERKRGSWQAQMRKASGLILCFSCHSPYSFTMRKCRPSSSLRMPTLPSHWRMSMARFTMRLMKVCVSRAWAGLAGDKRAGQGHGFVWSQGSDFLELTQPLLCSQQISIFVDPCDALHSVLKELRSEKVEQIKVTQTQHNLCTHSQTHLLPPITTSDSEPWTPSLTLQLPMKERHDASQQSLDIQRLCSDPGMATAVIVEQVRAEGSSWEGYSGMVPRGGVGAGAVPARSLSASVSLLLASWRLDDPWYWNAAKP